MQSNECGRIHYICKNAKGELKIYSNTKILTINFKKIIYPGKKSLFITSMTLSFLKYTSDSGSLNNMKLSCTEFLPVLQIH